MYLNDNHQITIYLNVDFMPNDNITFDDIESHLKLFSALSPKDIGPNRNVDEIDMNFTLKIDVHSVARFADHWCKQINYCKISSSNNGTSYYYYFITDCNLLSEGTLELTLQLDTLNSFSKYVNDSNYWSTRTVTSRQHKDRFDSDHNIVIDQYDEGFGTLPQYKVSDTKLAQTDNATKWYLVYESDNEDEKSPLKGKVYCNTSFDTNISVLKAVCFTKLGINTGVYYWDTRYHSDGYTHTMVINGKSVKDVKWMLADLNNKKIYYGLSDSEYGGNGGVVYRNAWSNPVVVDYDETKETYIGQYWTWSSAGYATAVLGWYFALQYDNSFYWQYQTSSGVNSLYINGEGMQEKRSNGSINADWTIATIEDVDRTNKLINKIVECPYCPLQLENGVIKNISINFENDDVNDLYHYGPLYISTKQEYSYASKVIDVQLIDKITLPTTRTQSDIKDIQYETKLLNSNFSKVKFTYDSFTKELKRELFNEPLGKVGVSYYQSLNMSSKLMFYFNSDYQESDDYDKYLTCSRNNESTLYNSQYLDYIRNGYNYDIKNKALSDQKNALAIGTSVVGTGLSLASNMGALGKFSSVQQGIGIVSNIVNMTINNAQQELALEQKKNEALNTTVGVSGTDDASLLNVYNGNKLHMIKYSVRTNLKNSIYEQFYLTGYACNDYGRPNLTTRQNFNYIQATTTIDTLVPVPTRVKTDIMNRISNGILIIHKCSDSLGGLFNYENWETSI